MTLARGDYVSSDYNRRVFSFTMRHGDAVISCSASYEFVDRLDPGRKLVWKERDDQFGLLRGEIERRADRKFCTREPRSDEKIELRSIDPIT